MCTVTFVRDGSKTIITSNRDEVVVRPAIEPREYLIDGKPIIFPKDVKAGGTWYAADKSGNVLVLLNGAREKHEFRSDYRKSRGLIVLEIISGESPIDVWKGINLENIEPFTLVLFHSAELFQLQWDGNQKDTASLNSAENYIWSSATLYPKEIRQRRAAWFDEFLKEHRSPEESDMMHFHRYTKNDDSESGLVINRENFLKTLSITQTVIKGTDAIITHHDLTAGMDYSQSFTIKG